MGLVGHQACALIQSDIPLMLEKQKGVYVFLPAVDILESGSWQCFKDLEDPELKRLAEMLLSYISNCNQKNQCNTTATIQVL